MELRYISTVYENGLRHTTQTCIPFEEDGGREELLLNLYPRITYQTLSGFGGAITDSAAYIYSLMDSHQKEEMMREYFGRDNMQYRFVRIPMDSCDFSLAQYEAAGEEQDALLENFSFERVEAYILPMLADAEKACGRKLEIMLSPWSPPAYMKTNGQRSHGGKLKACYRKRWAEYICRYIEEYRRRGFHVTMLTMQNEPKAVQTWDSCIYTAKEEKDFLRDYLWPSLLSHGLEDIEVYIWDHNKERALEWTEAIIDEETDSMIAGIAFHWYSGDHFESLRMIKERFPGKKLLLSEACIEFSKYSKESHLKNAQKYAHDIIGNLNEGMDTFLDWNLVLDESGGPNHVQNYCDAPYLFHTGEKRLMERELRSYVGHFSSFLHPGAIRIGLSRYTTDLEATAFQTSKGIAVVLLNRTDRCLPVYIRLGDMCAKAAVQPQSIATCLIEE